ncbi:epimerase [Candidatus Entotheonella serta]|nr:epimerase [Candidatus Entotheonella serta]
MLDQYRHILVTGGLGFVGRHLVRALSQLEKQVRVLDLNVAMAEPDVPTGVDLVKGDVRVAEEVRAACEGIDLIFHTAANANGSISVQDLRFDFETNVLGTLNILDAAKDVGIQRLVYMSSAAVYGTPQYFPMDEAHPTRPFIPYGVSKYTGELYALASHATYGLPVVAGRPFCVYGTGENPKTALVEVGRYVRWHLNEQPIQIVGDSHRKTRDFVHVSDLVATLLILADRGELGQVYNIGSGEEISMYDLAQVIGDTSGRTAEICEISEIMEDTFRLVGDIRKLSQLDYRPQMSIQDGVKELVEALGPFPELPGSETIFKPSQHGMAVVE